MEPPGFPRRAGRPAESRHSTSSYQDLCSQILGRCERLMSLEHAKVKSELGIMLQHYSHHPWLHRLPGGAGWCTLANNRDLAHIEPERLGRIQRAPIGAPANWRPSPPAAPASSAPARSSRGAALHRQSRATACSPASSAVLSGACASHAPKPPPLLKRLKVDTSSPLAPISAGRCFVFRSAHALSTSASSRIIGRFSACTRRCCPRA